jgi:hypothetical protein
MDSRDACNTPPGWNGTARFRRGRWLGALLVLIFGCLFASAACRAHEERAGTASQSGGAGPRAREPWRSTGGVLSLPAPERCRTEFRQVPVRDLAWRSLANTT